MNEQNTPNTNEQQNPAVALVALADKTYHEYVRGGLYSQIISHMANLVDYTLRNQMLIMQQCPVATDVNNKKSWSYNNRKVTDESKAIKILSPRMEKTVVVKDGIVDEKEKFGGYDVTEVFDISATEIANIEKDVTNQMPENLEPYYNQIADGLKKSFDSFKYSEAEIEQDGILDTMKKTIIIKQGLTPKQYLQVLVDQIAAAQVICRDKSKIYGLTSFNLPNISAIEISAVGNIVCQKLGLETRKLVEPDFTKMSDVYVEKFTKNLGSIRTISQRILTAIDNAFEKAVETQKKTKELTQQSSQNQTEEKPSTRKAVKKNESVME